MKRIVVLVLSLCWMMPLTAQADDAATKAVNDFLEATNSKENYLQLQQTMMQQLKASYMQMVQARLQRDQIPADKRANAQEVLEGSIQEFLTKFQNSIDTIMPWDELVKNVYTPIYLEEFTVEELNAATEFFRSEAGQTFVNKNPLIVRKSATLIQQQYLPQLNDVARSEMQAVLQKTKQQLGVTD